jgi:hypothetical protein
MFIVETPIQSHPDGRLDVRSLLMNRQRMVNEFDIVVTNAEIMPAIFGIVSLIE